MGLVNTCTGVEDQGGAEFVQNGDGGSRRQSDPVSDTYDLSFRMGNSSSLQLPVFRMRRSTMGYTGSTVQRAPLLSLSRSLPLPALTSIPSGAPLFPFLHRL